MSETDKKLSRRAFFGKVAQKTAAPAAVVLFSASVVPETARAHYGRPAHKRRRKIFRAIKRWRKSRR